MTVSITVVHPTVTLNPRVVVVTKHAREGDVVVSNTVKTVDTIAQRSVHGQVVLQGVIIVQVHRHLSR